MVDTAGNTFARARAINTGPTRRVFGETLSAVGDRSDFFSFRLNRSTSIDATLTGMQAGKNIDLILYNRNRQRIASSAQPSNNFEAIRTTLGAGLWYLQVVWRGGAGRTPYKLGISGNVDLAGQRFAQARIGGTLNSTARVFADYTGRSDRTDLYRIRIGQRSTFEATVKRITSQVSIELYDARGVRLSRKNQSGIGSRTLSNVLDPGIYYINVLPGAPAVIGSRYQLSLAATAIPDGAGNTLQNAREITVGFVETSFSDFVGAADPVDYYTFQNNIVGGDLVLKVLDTDAELSINLFTENGAFLSSGAFENGVTTLRSDGFPAGTYFFNIVPTNATTSSSYTLTTILAPPDNVGDTEGEATLVTTPGTAPFLVLGPTIQPYRDFVGGTDVDFFKFVFTNETNFLSVNLRELTANLNLEFFREGSTNKILSDLGGTNVDAFEGSVSAGTYYLRVFAPNPNVGSGYNLEMSVSSAANRPSITRDVNPIGDSSARLLTEVRNVSSVFFAANDNISDPNGAVGLWKTGGALDTTIKVGSFISITSMQAIGNTLYIAGDRTGTGLELYKWEDNGSETGLITLVSDLTPGTAGSQITELTAVGNILYFLASPAGSGQERALYRSDGTSTGTALVSNAGIFPGGLEVAGTTLYYRAEAAGIGGDVLWQITNASTLTPGIPTTLTSFSTGSGPIQLRSVSSLQAVGNDLYFVSQEVVPGVGGNPDDVLNLEWRRLSGGILTTFDPDGGTVSSSLNGVAQPQLTVVGDYAYFAAQDGQGVELFRADLTTGATTGLPQINNNIFGGNANPASFTSYRGQLFFTATSGDGDQELYVIADPTSATTPTLTKVDLFANTDSSSPSRFIVASDRLYFVATNESGTEIWRYDGAGVATDPTSYNAPFFDIATGALGSDPDNLILVGDVIGDGVGGRLYFTANDGNRGREVWVI